MKLTEFPNEVLHEIADNLFLPDLAHFSLLCRKILKVGRKRAAQQLVLRKKYRCVHSFDAEGQYCDWPNILDCWTELDQDQSYTYVQHLVLYSDRSPNSKFQKNPKGRMALFDPPHKVSAQHKDQGKLRALRTPPKAGCAAGHAKSKIYNSLLVCLPNLRSLDIDGPNHTAIYTTKDDIYKIVTLIARLQPQPALSKLHTVRCLHVESAALSTIVPFMALPNVRVIELNRCIGGYDSTYPTGCPHSRVQRIDLLRSDVSRKTIRDLAANIVGPCEIRIEWATVENEEMADPLSKECDWDTCLISPDVEACPHIERVMFTVKDEVTCKWRSQRGRERLDLDDELVPRVPMWVKEWMHRDHDVFHNVHEEIVEEP